jgi:hypothetical protein
MNVVCVVPYEGYEDRLNRMLDESEAEMERWHELLKRWPDVVREARNRASY